MWIRVEARGQKMGIRNLLFVRYFLREVLVFFHAYFVVFGLFIPKTEKKTYNK